MLGFAGVMGAGRSEIARCIYGLDRKHGGEILLDGEVVSIKSPADAIRHGILMCTEDRKGSGLILCRSVAENIMLPSLQRLGKFGFCSFKKETELVERMIKELNIKTPKRSTLTNSLSGGNQQKVILAKWLLMNPKVLILDEPTRGIDVGAKDAIYHIMSSLTARGISILLISSDMPEVIGLSDRVAVISGGRVMGMLEKDDITQEKIMALAAKGEN